MNVNLQKAVAWPYFHPLFSEATIEDNGKLGLAQSGANLAVWSAAVGAVAHLAGFKHPFRIAIGAFGVLVLAELLFGVSGPSTNGFHAQIFNAPGTATPVTASGGGPVNGYSIASGGLGGFDDGESNYGSDGGGFN